MCSPRLAGRRFYATVADESNSSQVAGELTAHMLRYHPRGGPKRKHHRSTLIVLVTQNVSEKQWYFDIHEQ